MDKEWKFHWIPHFFSSVLTRRWRRTRSTLSRKDSQKDYESIISIGDPRFENRTDQMGMSLGVFPHVRVLSSCNTLLTYKTQHITRRWWLYTSYVGGSLGGHVAKHWLSYTKGECCVLSVSHLVTSTTKTHRASIGMHKGWKLSRRFSLELKI